MELLFKNATVVTLNDENEILTDACLGIEDGRIAYIGADAPELRAERVIDGRDLVLMPGMVNTHTHLAMAALRGWADDYTLDDWLYGKIIPAESRLDRRRVEIGTQLGLLEAIRCGTVGVCDMYFESPAVARILKDAGLRAKIGNPPLALGDDFSPDDRSIRETLELAETYRDDPYITPVNGVHAAQTTNPKVWEWVREVGERYRLPLIMHMSETESDREGCIRRFGASPTKILAKAGLFDLEPVAAHGVWVDDEDIGILAEKNVSISHCPVSNLKLASGVAPIFKYMKAGVNVTLGTDGAASNNSLDLFAEMKLCALLQKNLARDASAIKASDVLRFATVNGAKALGRGARSGIIAKGRDADIIALDFDSPNLLPCYDVVSNLVYAARGSDVAMTLVGGRVLYERGTYTTLDLEAVKYAVRHELVPFMQS